MLKCLTNDGKIQMRLNIKRHRQKLLQYLENTNDTVLKPKIKLISNNIEKSYLNHNVKPKIASSAELPTPKLLSTIKVTNYKNKSNIRVKTFEHVINTKPKNLEDLTDDIKIYETRSSITVKQPQPKVKVNIQKEPLSNVELKLEPSPNIEIKDLKPPPPAKKHKEQLLKELFHSSSSEEIDDDISVGDVEDCNGIFQIHNENDSSNSSHLEAVRYGGYKQLANDRSKEKYMYDSDDSDSPILNINEPTTRKRSWSRKKNILTNPQFEIDQSKHRFRKPQDRTLHNAKERACRERIAKKFATLRNSCSYLNSNRRVPSKHSILLAAKKECDLLKHFEKKMLAEKKVWHRANEILKNRIAVLSHTMRTTNQHV